MKKTWNLLHNSISNYPDKQLKLSTATNMPPHPGAYAGFSTGRGQKTLIISTNANIGLYESVVGLTLEFLNKYRSNHASLVRWALNSIF